MSTPHQTALALAEAIRTGTKTAVSVLEETLAQIEATDGALQAFNHLTPEHALATAKAVDADIAAGKPVGPLAGVPLALKDNIHLKGVKTTCSSRILENFVAPYDATVTQKLHQAGIPIVGKTNLDEFAMGSSTENSAFRKTKNPWDIARVPGGSSGGSATAVAGSQVTLSLGSDTGGSVRQPASFCGIVGFKPTYGLVSRYGLVAFASSLDQISPFAANVSDLAALLDVIVGHDPLDSTSLPEAPAPQYLAQLTQAPSSLKIGVIQELMEAGLDPEVQTALEKAIAQYQALGATIVPVSLPHLPYATATYYLIATAEASANLARYDGVRYGLRTENPKDLMALYLQTRAEGFGPEVKRRIMLGTFALSSGYYDAYYGKAQAVRQKIRQDFANAFAQCDLLLGPTSPTTAFKVGEKSNDPLQMYLSDIATIPVNLAGIPAVSLPCGLDSKGLPIGLQLFGPHLSETKLLQAAYAYEQASGYGNLIAQRQTVLN